MSLSLFSFGLGLINFTRLLTLRIETLFFVVIRVLFIVASFQHFSTAFALLVFVVEFMDALNLLDLSSTGLPYLTNFVFNLIDYLIV